MDLYKLRKRNTHPHLGSNWNCLFYAVSDQLFDTTEKAMEIRYNTVKWLREHKDWKLPSNNNNNNPTSSNAAENNITIASLMKKHRTWEEYCESLESDAWGDPIALIGYNTTRYSHRSLSLLAGTLKFVLDYISNLNLLFQWLIRLSTR